MFTQNRNIEIKNYIITFFVIAQAGIPFFIGDTWLILIFFITTFLGLKEIFKYNFRPVLGVILVASLIMLMQFITTGNIILGPFLGILFRILFISFVFVSVGVNFIKYYIQIIYYFSIISIFFYVILSLNYDIYASLNSFSYNYIKPLELYPSVRTHIILYTNDSWLQIIPPRNAGPFWEPGGFGVFLNLALIFNLILKSNIFSLKNLVLIFSVITTFSLGSYITLFLIISGYFIVIKKFKIYNFLILSVFSIFAYNSFNEYDFLGEKFYERKTKAESFNPLITYDNLTYRVGRNEQFILDLRSFKKYPIFGEGQFTQNQFNASASGITAFLRIWGLVGAISFFLMMYFSLKKFTSYTNSPQSYALVLLIVIISLGISQSIFGKPLFIGLSFLFLCFDQKKIKDSFFSEK